MRPPPYNRALDVLGGLWVALMFVPYVLGFEKISVFFGTAFLLIGGAVLMLSMLGAFPDPLDSDHDER